jgi:hypothetical protein
MGVLFFNANLGFSGLPSRAEVGFLGLPSKAEVGFLGPPRGAADFASAVFATFAVSVTPRVFVCLLPPGFSALQPTTRRQLNELKATQKMKRNRIETS